MFRAVVGILKCERFHAVSLSSSVERSVREVANPKTQSPQPRYSESMLDRMELGTIIFGAVALWCAALWVSHAVFK